MSVVEVTTFRLAAAATAGAEDPAAVTAFLAADRRIQTELVPNQPGFMRRTTARDGADWVVVTLWASRADAAAFDMAAAGHAVQIAFEGHLDRASVATRHYDTLD